MHVGQQAFAAPYAPACPTRATHPDEATLLGAAAILRNNGRFHAHAAERAPPGGAEHTQARAQAATHLGAAEGCARWAVELAPSSHAAWQALLDAVRANAPFRAQGARCFVQPPAGAASAARAARAASEREGSRTCAERITAVMARLEGRGRGPPPPRGGVVRALAAAQADGEARNRVRRCPRHPTPAAACAACPPRARAPTRAPGAQTLVCRLSGGLGELLEGIVSCAGAALALRRALRLEWADPTAPPPALPFLAGGVARLYAAPRPSAAWDAPERLRAAPRTRAADLTPPLALDAPGWRAVGRALGEELDGPVNGSKGVSRNHSGYEPERLVWAEQLLCSRLAHLESQPTVQPQHPARPPARPASARSRLPAFRVAARPRALLPRARRSRRRVD